MAARIDANNRATGGVWRPAHLYAALGETERALDMMEAALAGQRGRLSLLRCSLAYQLLRDEPRMQARLRPVRFPQ